MRLKIQNYKNIIGTYGKWAIVNVVELPDYYSFTVKEPNNAAKYKDIVVKRNGRFDNDGEWVYHFGNGSHNSQCVTPKWFENKENAVSAILSEYDT